MTELERRNHIGAARLFASAVNRGDDDRFRERNRIRAASALAESPQLMHVVPLHVTPTLFTTSYDGRRVAVVAPDADKIVVLDLSDPTQVIRVDHVVRGVRHASLDPRGTRLLVAAEKVQIRDAIANSVLTELDVSEIERDSSVDRRYHAHFEPTLTSWSADGSMVAVASSSRTFAALNEVRIWPANQFHGGGRLIASDVDAFEQIALSSTSRFLLGWCRENNRTAVCDVQSGDRVSLDSLGDVPLGFTPLVWSLEEDRFFAISGQRVSRVSGFQSSSAKRTYTSTNCTPSHGTVAFACSPTGDGLATADIDGFVRIYESADHFLKTAIPHLRRVMGVAYCLEGAAIATLTDDGCVRIWGVEEPTRSYQQHLTLQEDRWFGRFGSGAALQDVAVSPNGVVARMPERDSYQLGGCAEKGTFQLVDLPNDLNPLRVWDGGGLQFAPDFSRGWILVVDHFREGDGWLSDTRMRRIDLATGGDDPEWTAEVSASFLGVRQCQLSPNGEVLLTTHKDRPFAVDVWNTSAWKKTWRLRHDASVVYSYFSPDSKQAAIITEDFKHNYSITVWNIESDVPQRIGSLSLSGPLGDDTPVVRCRETNTWTVIAGGDVLSCDFSEGKVVWSYRELREGAKEDSGVAASALSADGELVAIGGADGRVSIWNVAEHKPVAELITRASPVSTLAFDLSGTLIASSDERGVFVFDARSGRRLRAYNEPLRRHADEIIFLGDNQRLFAKLFGREGLGSAAGRVWDSSAGARDPQATLPGLIERTFEDKAHGRVLSIRRSPIGQSLELKAVPPDHAAPSSSVRLCLSDELAGARFSGDGRILATNSAEGCSLHAIRGAVQLWNPIDGRPLSPEFAHPFPVLQFALSSDGRRLATLDESSTVRIWEVGAAGSLLASRESPYRVDSLHFSADGTLLSLEDRGDHLVLRRGDDGKSVTTIALPNSETVADGESNNEQFVRYCSIFDGGAKLGFCYRTAGGRWALAAIALADGKLLFDPIVDWDDRPVFSQDGRQCLRVGNRNAMQVWSLEDRAPMTAWMRYRPAGGAVGEKADFTFRQGDGALGSWRCTAMDESNERLVAAIEATASVAIANDEALAGKPEGKSAAPSPFKDLNTKIKQWRSVAPQVDSFPTEGGSFSPNEAIDAEESAEARTFRLLKSAKAVMLQDQMQAVDRYRDAVVASKDLPAVHQAFVSLQQARALTLLGRNDRAFETYVVLLKMLPTEGDGGWDELPVNWRGDDVCIHTRSLTSFDAPEALQPERGFWCRYPFRHDLYIEAGASALRAQNYERAYEMLDLAEHDFAESEVAPFEYERYVRYRDDDAGGLVMSQLEQDLVVLTALARDPKSPQFRQEFVEIMYESGEYDVVAAHVRRGLTFNPGDLNLMRRFASVIHVDEAAVARSGLEQWLESCDEDAGSLESMWLGRLCWHAGDQDSALRWIREAVARAPHQLGWRNELAVLCQLGGRPDEATQEFGLALRINAADAETACLAALHSLASGDIDRARKVLRVAIDRQPKADAYQSGLKEPEYAYWLTDIRLPWDSVSNSDKENIADSVGEAANARRDDAKSKWEAAKANREAMGLLAEMWAILPPADGRRTALWLAPDLVVESELAGRIAASEIADVRVLRYCVTASLSAGKDAEAAEFCSQLVERCSAELEAIEENEGDAVQRLEIDWTRTWACMFRAIACSRLKDWKSSEESMDAAKKSFEAVLAGWAKCRKRGFATDPLNHGEGPVREWYARALFRAATAEVEASLPSKE